MGFKQNAEMTYIKLKEATTENVFLTKEPDLTPPPKFEEVRDSLPQPVWDGHELELNCYWRAWELAFGNLRSPTPGTGFVSPFIDTAFNGCIFLWDSVFMMMFGKYAERQFHFQGTLDNFYSHQHRDGYICREITEATGEDRFTRFDPSATGPEVLAFAEWEYYQQFGDRERLAEVFPPLLAYHRWMASNHTWPVGTYFSSGWGCGMDNIPRHMPGSGSISFSHGHMVWSDACMQALMSARILADMAKVLGKEDVIDGLTSEVDKLSKVINDKLWDENSGFYYDLWKNGELNHVMHIGAYWALLAGCTSKERADRMIEHLNDPNTFRTPHRVPSLAKNHPWYSPLGEYWLGSIWAPTNYMVLRGLDLYDRMDLSHEIGLEHLRWVTSVFEDTGTLFENYAPEHGENGRPARGNHSKDEFVGWTGLVPISVMFEYVFGIKSDAANSKIIWDINLLERHGVQRYPFGKDGELTLMCDSRNDADETPVITASSNVPVHLEVRWGKSDSKKTMIVPCGSKEA